METDTKYVKLKDVEAGKLVRFKHRSDVYKVLESGYFVQLRNMYTDKVSLVKHYTNKGSRSLDRTVEVVKFY